MHPDRAGRAAWPALAATITVAVGIISIGFLLVPTRPGIDDPGAPFAILLMAAFVMVTPILGAVLAIRRPDNRIGWLFIAVVFFFVVSFLGDGVARHFPPTTTVAAFVVIANALGYFAFGVLFVVLQTFPTGHALPGWRWLPAGVLAGSAAQAIAGMFGPLSLTPPVPDLENPFARPALQPALDVLSAVSGVLLIVVAGGTLVALALRFRRSRGIERQQIKWFLWAGMLTVSMLGASLLTGPWAPISNALWQLALSTLVLLPIASAAAILRYRLWEIDRIVSRTIAYLAVTGILLAVFAGAVVGLQALLAGFTQGQTLAVAASTLIAFAMFQPVRRRVQLAVDRRFDRARYDAGRTADAFAARLRGRVDLAGVEADIVGTVAEALRPNSTAIWVRRSSGR